MRSSIIGGAELGVRELSFRGMLVRLAGWRAADVAAALRGVPAFTATRMATAFFATFADFLSVLLVIVFTPAQKTSPKPVSVPVAMTDRTSGA